MALYLVKKEVFKEFLNNSDDANFAKKILEVIKEEFVLNSEAEGFITKIISSKEIIEFPLTAAQGSESEFNVTTLGDSEINSFDDA